MSPLVRVKGAIVQEVDARQRRLTVNVPARSQGSVDALTMTVDLGAFVANKHHQLMKLEEFQIGNRVSVIYAQQPDGTLLAKSVILERGVSVASGRAVPR
jgi:hypothetical protein